MPLDPKSNAPAPVTPSVKHREHGIRIFTYPKVIFFFPTMIAAFVCGIGMTLIGDKTEDPLKAATTVAATDGTQPDATAPAPAPMARHERFYKSQNLMGVLFLTVFAFNLLIMGIDFPRFSVVAILLLVGFAVFFILWIGAYFDFDLMRPLRSLFGTIYAVANAEFYYMIGTILLLIFGIVYLTRWLDYWQIMPNEILHHHGPLSDLERYPTLNLKFDKEIPDVFEYLFLGSGKLVLHVADERKSIVLDNVLFINSKEDALKKLMSRLEVRVTTDQEVAEET